ncbi:N-6 DNA methylase [Desulfovibrio sp.]|uniref:Eco57I restriction-modification methylase domain-containing protein n=1 Tax=Desulfovibrio sp. TaxID=885 RepID=UPI0025C5F389|nr:N-6 DNA methylase [Desulfovibrio sp.]
MMIDLFADPRATAIDELHAATAIYTCSDIVDDLLGRLLWPFGDRVLVDPSCGDGMFLCRALVRLLEAEPEICSGRILALMTGWEVHPHASHSARVRIGEVLVDYGWNMEDARDCAGQMIRNADFLTAGPDMPIYDVIAGNPPYLIWSRVPALLREEYSAVVPRHAQADLLHSFLDRCSCCLNVGGEIALVTSDRWLFNLNSQKLREALGQRDFGLAHVERLDPRTAFYRPKNRKAGQPPRIHPVSVVLRKSDADLRRLSVSAIYPDAPDFDASKSGPTLEAVADVQLAPWLGGKGIFVVDKIVADALPGDRLVPAIDTSDVVDGILQSPTRYAILTYPGEEPPEAIRRHLELTMVRMSNRGLQAPKWQPPESFHALDLSQPRLMVPRITRSLRPIRVPAGVLPYDHNLTIVQGKALDLDQIEDLLLSPEAAEWFEICTPRLENGFRSLTTTLLKSLPVPERYLSGFSFNTELADMGVMIRTHC